MGNFQEINGEVCTVVGSYDSMPRKTLFSNSMGSSSRYSTSGTVRRILVSRLTIYFPTFPKVQRRLLRREGGGRGEGGNGGGGERREERLEERR
ncbi:hypothetical protein M0802_005486 [Mischocyttarus mexicanus]|nr:hypothetical protein M0802_005486 [Mischocyttarus mexicanus]